MHKLRNIKKMPVEIAQILAQDEIIHRLLVVDTRNALDVDKEEILLLPFNQLIDNKYISFFVPSAAALEDVHRNTWINIILDEVNFLGADENSRGAIAIYVFTDFSHVDLTNNRNRLLELSDEIVSKLDNAKLTSAGQISVSSVMAVTVGDFYMGYRINLSFTDQSNGKVGI